MLTPVVIGSRQFYALDWPLTRLSWLVILGILCSAFGYVFLFALLRVGGVFYYSMVSFVVALVGLFWGRLLFAETFSSWTYVAVSLILLAIMLASREKIKE